MSTSHVTQAPQTDAQALSARNVNPNSHLSLPASVRAELAGGLNPLLADAIVLRDLYRKSHWQVAGPTFESMHALFDRHHEAQDAVVDLLGERVETLGGVSVAMAREVRQLSLLADVPAGREGVSAQLLRLLQAHAQMLAGARELADRANRLGDVGTNDLLVSDVIRLNEKQVWVLEKHLVPAHLPGR